MPKNSYIFIKTGKCGTQYVRTYLLNCNYCENSQMFKGYYENMLKDKNYNNHLLSVSHIAFFLDFKSGYTDYLNKIMKHPVKYITCIRNPLERAISHYYYDRPSNLDYNQWYRKFHTNKYMNNNHPTNLTNNYMSKFLGFNSIDEITEENILNRYELVIIQNQINRGVEKLSKILGTEYHEYNIINANKQYSKQPEVDDDVKILFNKNNEMDNKLYALCCKIYDYDII